MSDLDVFLAPTLARQVEAEEALHKPPRVSYAIPSQQGRQLGHPASARSSSTIVAKPPKTMAAPTT